MVPRWITITDIQYCFTLLNPFTFDKSHLIYRWRSEGKCWLLLASMDSVYLEQFFPCKHPWPDTGLIPMLVFDHVIIQIKIQGYFSWHYLWREVTKATRKWKGTSGALLRTILYLSRLYIRGMENAERVSQNLQNVMFFSNEFISSAAFPATVLHSWPNSFSPFSSEATALKPSLQKCHLWRERNDLPS